MGYMDAVRLNQNCDKRPRNPRDEENIPINEKIDLNRSQSRQNLNTEWTKLDQTIPERMSDKTNMGTSGTNEGLTTEVVIMVETKTTMVIKITPKREDHETKIIMVITITSEREGDKTKLTVII